MPTPTEPSPEQGPEPGEKRPISRLRRWRNKLRESTPYLIISTLLFLFLVAYLFHRIFIIVPAGHAGVLYRTFAGGTEVEQVFDEGLHVIGPWNDMTIYDVRVQEVDKDFAVLTSDGLAIETTMSIRFRPTRRLLGMLHKEHGPRYVESFLIPELGSSARRVVGMVTPVAFYSTDRDSVESAIDAHLRWELREIDEFLYTHWPEPDGYADYLVSPEGQAASAEQREAIYDSLNLQLIVRHVRGDSLRASLLETGAVAYLMGLEAAYDSLADRLDITLGRMHGAQSLLLDTAEEVQSGFDDLHLVEADAPIRHRVDSLRVEARDFTEQMAYTKRRIDEIMEQYDRFFTIVDIHDVLVKAIELPPQIAQAIQNKLEQEQIAHEYVFRLQREEREAERKRIEAQGIRDFQEIIATGITDGLLKWKGIEATMELAKSENAKVVVIGAGENGLPIILGRD